MWSRRTHSRSTSSLASRDEWKHLFSINFSSGRHQSCRWIPNGRPTDSTTTRIYAYTSSVPPKHSRGPIEKKDKVPSPTAWFVTHRLSGFLLTPKSNGNSCSLCRLHVPLLPREIFDRIRWYDDSEWQDREKMGWRGIEWMNDQQSILLLRLITSREEGGSRQLEGAYSMHSSMWLRD